MGNATNEEAMRDEQRRASDLGPIRRFCASYPNISQCHRGASCAFAHSREEMRAPLLSEDEENHVPEALQAEGFFTERFKTLWCPIGAQHDWQSCVYAHTHQDARRKPSIGYGPQPCPFWSNGARSAAGNRLSYLQRCPLGLRCPYSHGAKEQLYHPKYFRVFVCRDMQMKGCPRQKLCAFFHKKSEKCSVGPDDVDYSAPLPKTAIEADWSMYFLSPHLFTESAGAGDSGGSAPSTMQSAASGSWMAYGIGASEVPPMPSRGQLRRANEQGSSSAAVRAGELEATAAELDLQAGTTANGSDGAWYGFGGDADAMWLTAMGTEDAHGAASMDPAFYGIDFSGSQGSCWGSPGKGW